MHLTDMTIRGLPHPEAGQQDYVDDLIPGLIVRIGRRTKTFMVVVSKDRQRERVTIGRYPEVSLARARSDAKAIIGEAQSRKNQPPTLTFEEAFALFKQTHMSQRQRERTAKEIDRLIRRHFLPPLGRKPLGQISTQDVAEIVDRILPTPAECSHAFAAARIMFRWAERRRLIDRSPMDKLPTPTKAVSRDRVLSDDELKAVFRAAQDDSIYSQIVRLLIILGQRKSQIANLRGEWIDRKERTIAWPMAEMKRERPHVIPFGDLAAAIFDAVPATGVLFPGRGKDTPFAGFSKSKLAFDRQLKGVDPYTIHDLRRTVASCWQRMGVRIEVTERLLAHTSGTLGGIVSVYQRHSYLPELRAAMDQWEAKLKSFLTEPSTIPSS